MHYLVFGNHQSQSYIFKKSQRYFWTLTFSNILKCIRPSVAYCSPTWWLTSNINNTSEPGPWIHHSMATGIEAVVFITLLTYCVHVDETKVTADKNVRDIHIVWCGEPTYEELTVQHSTMKYFTYIFHKIAKNPEWNQSFSTQCSEHQWNCAVCFLNQSPSCPHSHWL